MSQNAKISQFLGMYHVSFVWLTARPTLYWEKYPKTHAINAHQRTDRLTSREGGILFSLRWTTHPSEKGQVFLVLLGEGWGQRTGNAQ